MVYIIFLCFHLSLPNLYMIYHALYIYGPPKNDLISSYILSSSVLFLFMTFKSNDIFGGYFQLLFSSDGEYNSFAKLKYIFLECFFI